MTREHKLALIIGFTLVLVVGVLLSDHLSTGSGAKVGGPTVAEANVPKNEQLMFNPEASKKPADAPTSLVSATNTQPTIETDTFSMGASKVGAEFKQAIGDLANGNGKVATTLVPVDPPTGSPATPGASNPNPGTDSHNPGSPLFVDSPSKNTGLGGDNSGLTTGKPTPAGSGVTPATPAKSGKRYQIAEGDTFWKIAKAQYSDGSLADKLKAYNADRIGKNGQLRVGASILIPEKAALSGKAEDLSKKATELAAKPEPAASKPTGTEKTAAKTSEAKSKGATTYVVQANDTISKIAAKLLGSSSRYNDILSANNLGEDDTITPGMTLKIPAR